MSPEGSPLTDYAIRLKHCVEGTHFKDDGLPVDTEMKAVFRLPSLSEFSKKLSTLVKPESFNYASELEVDENAFEHAMKKLFPELHSLLNECVGEYEHVTESLREGCYSQIAQGAYLNAYLRKRLRNSMLTEFALCYDGDRISCVPYHSNALHEVEMPKGGQLVMARPAVIANSIGAVFTHELAILENLLNQPSTKEKHLQRFLEEHPTFLKNLNYSDVYSQVVLEKDNGERLRPDFILESFTGGWCDILDIKLPVQPIVNGRRDRKSLAAGIHEVVAQLREYAAYFEEEKYRKRVADKYGLKVYMPRMIAVVGRDMKGMETEQIRRALTQYPDCRIMTFDELIRHSRSRLLI